jgi:RNA polymerase sigma-70 factor (ECF subfamily)
VPFDAFAETLGAETAAPAAEPAPSPEDEAARRELGRLVERAVGTLPADFRAVFVLRALEQMSIEDTAAALGLRPATVKTRFHRANRLLRTALAADLGRVFDDAFPFAGARCERIVQAVLARLRLA